MALITAAEVRDVLPSLTGTGADTLLDTLVAGVGRAFARYCGYPAASVGGNPTMESASYTRYLDGDGTRELVLDIWPATAITSIEDDLTEDFDGSTYLVASADYTLREGNRGLVLLKATASHGVWNKGRRNIKAVFTAGFSTVPDDLKHLAKMGTLNWYNLRSTQGKGSTGADGQSESFRDEMFLPAVVKQGIASYRLPRVFL